MRDSRRGAVITMQSMPDVLGHWNRLLHVRTLLARWYNRKQVHLIRAGSLLHPELLHQEGPATRSQVREQRRLQRIPHGKTTSKEVSKETICKHSWSIYPWHVVQKDDDRVGSLWRSHPWKWTDLQVETTLTTPPKQKLTSTVATGGFARTWWISIRCRQDINLDFKKALSTLHRLKKTEDNAHSENWSQSSSSSWWQWQTSWWHPYYETSPRRWTWH